MKTDFRSLPWRCLTTVGMVPLVALPSKTFAESPPEVSCATPDIWTGAARISKATPGGHAAVYRINTDYSGLMDDAIVMGGGGAQVSASRTTGSGNMADGLVWRSTYRGQGLGRTRGWARARILRRGVLWSVDPRDIGATQRQAGAALLREGASTIFHRRDGLVIFRAPAASRDAIAARAAASIGRSPSTAAAVPDEAASGRTSAQRASSASIDVAIMRVEGSYSNGPTGFIDALPGGMFVYPFGTSFVVHVPRERVEDMWNAIDGEGHRVLMVGASSSTTVGTQVASAIRFCGGTALMKRFPTPRVIRSDRTGVVMDLESQALGAQLGDVVMVVQSPPYGRGMELAIMRVVAR